MKTDATYLLKMDIALKVALKRLAWKRRKTIKALLLDTVLANDPELRNLYYKLLAERSANHGNNKP